MSDFTINVNGSENIITTDTSTPLLWVIREYLNLHGTKFGCGKAQCGACTVLIDGVAQRSCVFPISAALDKKITTIEGIPLEHPIKQAWIKLNVPQCGYCQSGQMMQAISLLSNNQNPSLEEIKTEMYGNICRCGTYQKIYEAIGIAAKNQLNDVVTSPDSSQVQETKS